MIRRLMAGLGRRLVARYAGSEAERGFRPVCFSTPAGTVVHVDTVEGPGAGVLRVAGWCAASQRPALHLRTRAGHLVDAAVSCKRYRPDLVAQGRVEDAFAGFRDDFHCDPDDPPVALACGERTVHVFERIEPGQLALPDYAHFHTMQRRVGRESVYGTGPSVDVSTEFKAFAAHASGRILDFGCGNGDLAMWLRARGCDAVGIELDREAVRTGLRDDARPYVTLYPGGLPLPWADGAFESIVATEVIEHVEGPERFAEEFHRLLVPGGRALVTVPDATSIPASHPTGTVPWHLLESTHINFFNVPALASTFAPWFRLETVFGLGDTRVNGCLIPGSIGAVLRRVDHP